MLAQLAASCLLLIACRLCSCGGVLSQVLGWGSRWWFVDLSETDWIAWRGCQSADIISLPLGTGFVAFIMSCCLFTHSSYNQFMTVIYKLYTQRQCRVVDGFVVCIVLGVLTINCMYYYTIMVNTEAPQGMMWLYKSRIFPQLPEYIQMCHVCRSSHQALREVLCNCTSIIQYIMPWGDWCEIMRYSILYPTSPKHLIDTIYPMWYDVTGHTQYLNYFHKCTDLRGNKWTMKIGLKCWIKVFRLYDLCWRQCCASQWPALLAPSAQFYFLKTLLHQDMSVP